MLLSEGLSEPEIYGDLAHKFKKRIGRNDFFLFITWLITMLASLMHAGGSGVRLYDCPDIKLFI